MRALLDTHAFLWWVLDSPDLSSTARRFIADGRNEIHLSAASAIEMAIKVAQGRLTLPEPLASYVPDRLASEGFRPLPVDLRHALRVADLPPIHRDPFDRILVAQSIVEAMPIITADRSIGRYAVETIW